VELAIQAVDAKVRRWEETLEKGCYPLRNVLDASKRFARNERTC
jgi:hypothetical protein